MRRALAVSLLALAVAGACGGSGANPTGPGPSDNPFRITISSSGIVSPVELVVPPGTRVLFVNQHAQPHEMTSDAHPDHLECPEINSVGLLNAGQSRETGNLVAVRTCGFHDHVNPDDSRLRGRIVIR
jgi:hypothetical protein